MIFGKQTREDFFKRTFWVFPNIPWWGDKGICVIDGKDVISFEEGKRRLYGIEEDLGETSFFDDIPIEEEYYASEMLQISHECIGKEPHLIQYIDSVTGEILREESEISKSKAIKGSKKAKI